MCCLMFVVVLTQAGGIRGGRIFAGVCLSVCLFFCMVSQKPMQPGSPDLTWKCSTVIPGNPFILGSKDKIKVQVHEAQKQRRHGLLHSLLSAVMQYYSTTTTDPHTVILYSVSLFYTGHSGLYSTGGRR